MPILPGTRLGPYEILSAIGAGGMGEVYQAHDSKLGRDVAIKVLPEAFAHDPERLSRFQREAKMLASLNHPNIATIHGLEHSDGVQYLVMELVSGESLADRIRAGPVPVEEALKIAVQIAEALEAAHEKSIIHRDLKPANVKLTPEGKVKVLDFGLAKAFAGDAAADDPSNSPTLSAAATMQGTILGTAAYMSPEQARGKACDKRTDIWAFGCVLYELLSGHKAFEGEDTTEILAAVVRAEPDWTRLPENTPQSIRLLLRRCLRKDRRQRFQDATDVRIEIEDALSGAAAARPAAADSLFLNPGRIMRIGIYARVSTKDQSCELQIRDLRTYCTARGFDLVREYVDVGQSGAKDSRPELNKLMDDARKRQFDAIVVWRFDRFARSTKHLLSALEEFRALGIQFISYQENIDTSSALGQAMFTIVSAVAQLERDIIRERINSGISNARANGTRFGRPTVLVNRTQILELRSQGHSLQQIATDLGIGYGTVRARLQIALAENPSGNAQQETNL